MLKSLMLLTTVFSLALPAPAAAQSGADARERARELAQERADRARERAQERAERDRDRAQERREREQSGSLDTVVSFDARGSLSVTCPGGTVVVAGAEKNEIRVHARIENGAIRFTSSGARASLEPSSGRGCSDARFEVTVPFGTRVSATTWSGSVSVRGVRGDIEAHAQSGDVQVRDAGDRLDIETLSGDVVVAGVRGEATINTVSGGIALTGARGDVTVESVSGDLDLRDVVSSQIRAHTTSGDIAFLGAILDAGRYEFITHSGEVTLSLPADIGAELGVSTFSGGIESDFPITLKAGEHGIGAAQAKRLTFTVGRGTARIIAETFSGDITLKRRR
ncbi:MAG: DUF4097 family beta strand repeat protein [Polaromonas sp.]|nr:DUF4097 family beta strand repeat protein [Gemmatimonadaceae bacterium]